MPMRAATVVQVLQDFLKFYCMFYFTCDLSFSCEKMLEHLLWGIHHDNTAEVSVCERHQERADTVDVVPEQHRH